MTPSRAIQIQAGTLLTLRHASDAIHFEVAELVNLQAVRDAARAVR